MLNAIRRKAKGNALRDITYNLYDGMEEENSWTWGREPSLGTTSTSTALLHAC